MRNIVKEACVERLDEAILAEKNGADRIELCSRLDLDGLTPHRNMIQDVINSVKIPVKVMISPATTMLDESVIVIFVCPQIV